jgi:hypothetical protein
MMWQRPGERGADPVSLDCTPAWLRRQFGVAALIAIDLDGLPGCFTQDAKVTDERQTFSFDIGSCCTPGWSASSR